MAESNSGALNVSAFLQKSKASSSKFPQALEACKSSRRKFEDKDFPPTKFSLFGQKSSAEPLNKYGEFEWKRLGDLKPVDQLHLFNRIEPSDIKPGSLKNAYFVSALCVLAETPNLIRFLFESDEANEWGVYSVWLFYNGEWRNFLIDDFVPVEKNKENILFTSSASSQLWVPLLEKAYAKAYGGYSIIGTGSIATAMSVLTGAPVSLLPSLKSFPSNKLSSDISSFLSQSYPAVALKPAALNEEESLSGSDSATIQSVTGTGENCMLTIKKHDGEKPSQISLEEFLKMFEAVLVVKRQSSYFWTFLPPIKTSKGSMSVFSFALNEPGPVYVLGTHSDERGFRYQNTSNEPIFKRMTLIKETPGAHGANPSVIDIKTTEGLSLFVSGTEKSKDGKYFVIAEAFGPEELEETFSLSIYAKHLVEPLKVQGNQEKHNALFAQSLASLLSWESDFEMVKAYPLNEKEAEVFEYRLKQKSIEKLGFALVLWVNRSKNLKMEKILEIKETPDAEVFYRGVPVHGKALDVKVFPGTTGKSVEMLWVKLSPLSLKKKKFLYENVLSETGSVMVKEADGHEIREGSIGDRNMRGSSAGAAEMSRSMLMSGVFGGIDQSSLNLMKSNIKQEIGKYLSKKEKETDERARGRYIASNPPVKTL